MMRDLVVVLPGITGSRLSRRENGSDMPLWDLSIGTMWEFLVRGSGHLSKLMVPEHDPRSGSVETSVHPSGLISGFHGIYGLGRIAGYRGLVEGLCKGLDLTHGGPYDEAPANLVEFPYDWRLSCRHNARELRSFVDRKLSQWQDFNGEPGAKVVLVAHSMGGLVSRYYLEVTGDSDDRGDGQWRKCRALFTFGTPFRGSVDAVGYVANGYKKMFRDLTDFVRNCPSIYELMPVYRAIKEDGAWYRPNEVSIPNAIGSYVLAAKDFHDEIKDAVTAHEKDAGYRKNRYSLFPFVGVGQSTLQSAVLNSKSLRTDVAVPEWIDNRLAGGDGTVPRLSATPLELSGDHRETFLGEQHGFLHSNAYFSYDLVQRIEQLQSAGLEDIQGGGLLNESVIGVTVDDLYADDEPVIIRAVTSGDSVRLRLEAVLQRTDGEEELSAQTYPLIQAADIQETILPALPPGQYKLTIRAGAGPRPYPAPVHASFEVAGRER